MTAVSPVPHTEPGPLLRNFLLIRESRLVPRVRGGNRSCWYWGGLEGLGKRAGWIEPVLYGGAGWLGELRSRENGTASQCVYPAIGGDSWRGRWTRRVDRSMIEPRGPVLCYGAEEIIKTGFNHFHFQIVLKPPA